MSLAVVATVFAVIFTAELPDKTALASLILGSRYRPWWVYTGVAAAFAVHVGLAIAAGSLLGLLPHRPLEIIVAVLFALGAVLLLRGRHGDDDEHVELHGREPGFWRVAGLSFMVILVAEFGTSRRSRPQPWPPATTTLCRSPRGRSSGCGRWLASRSPAGAGC